MAHDVFISYSAQDKAVAEAVCAALESKHIRCWIAPRDIKVATDFTEAIPDAIDGSRILVLVFSAVSNSSQHVISEVDRAFNNDIPILPLRIEDVPLSKSMQYLIGRRHWLDAVTPPLEKHLQQLTERVQELLAQQHRMPEVTEIAEVKEKPAIAVGNPVLRVDREGLYFTDLIPGDRGTKSFTLRNTGTGRLTGAITTSQPWLKVSPDTVDLEQGGKRIQVSVNTAGLTPGFNGFGHVNTATNGGQARIRVDLSIAAVTKPQLGGEAPAERPARWFPLGRKVQAAAPGGTTAWFERLVEKAGIRYQLFFALVGCLLYGGGVTLAGMTGNLSEFITEPKWACFIALLAATGVALFYTLRKFDSSVDRLKEVVELSEDKLSEEKRRLRGSVTVPVYWIPVVFLVAWYLSMVSIVGGGLVDWGGFHSHWMWWDTYNSPHLFNVYYQIMCLPWFLVSAIYLCVVAVGLNLAYARLCFRTRFRDRELLTRGTRVFNGFGRLTIVTFACLVMASLSYLYLWNPVEPHLWTFSVHLPIGAIYLLAMALPGAFLPHYFFYRLLSRTKSAELDRLDRQIAAVSKDPTISERQRKKTRSETEMDMKTVESARTSLISVRLAVEFALVSIAHLALTQLLPLLQ